ncbi:MAG: helix-turn-helix domain-containing protein [Acidobacteria bacterium]|jgi:hypothetical protein|nr:helix-turn-helix domain-containing protein [Acidobacteriota bacterium]
MCNANNNLSSENKKYYDILEIKTDASFQEIKNAYNHLKKLYSSEPTVLIPIVEDLSREDRLEILAQLEEAYTQLKKIYKVEEKETLTFSQNWVGKHNIPEFQLYNGHALKVTREVLGVELKEIALSTGIPINHLKNIELERLDSLPPQGYIKVFLKKYAEYLALDSQKVMTDYLTLYDKKKKSKN